MTAQRHDAYSTRAERDRAYRRRVERVAHAVLALFGIAWMVGGITLAVVLWGAR